MRTYSALTKKQLVKWLNNFDDDIKISAFDDKGRTVTKIELLEYPVFDKDDCTQYEITLSIKGR